MPNDGTNAAAVVLPLAQNNNNTPVDTLIFSKRKILRNELDVLSLPLAATVELGCSLTTRRGFLGAFPGSRLRVAFTR